VDRGGDLVGKVQDYISGTIQKEILYRSDQTYGDLLLPFVFSLPYKKLPVLMCLMTQVQRHFLFVLVHFLFTIRLSNMRLDI
jgi:hypothetical protein